MSSKRKIPKYKELYVPERANNAPIHGMRVEAYWCPSCTGTDFIYVLQGSELRTFKKWLLKHDEPANDHAWNRCIRFVEIIEMEKKGLIK